MDSMESLAQNAFTFGCMITLVILYIIASIYKSTIDIFGLVTVNTLIANTYTWNLLTCSALETSILKLILDIAMLLLIPSTISRTPIDQFCLYILFTILTCSLGTSFYCLVRFFSTGLEETVMEPIYGFNGILIAYLMYCRQSLKHQSIHHLIPHITFHNTPILILITQLFAWCFGFKFIYRDIPFTFISILFSWSYLRFYYKHENNIIGNADSDFNFVVMFPDVLHPIMVPFTTAFYNIFVLFGIFPEFESSETRPQHHLR